MNKYEVLWVLVMLIFAIAWIAVGKPEAAASFLAGIFVVNALSKRSR